MKEVRYFYVPDAANASELPQDEAVHAIRVLRLQPDDDIFLMDGKGTFYEAKITLVTNKKCMYSIVSNSPQQPAWQGHIHLAIAPTKMMERMEWMAEKATEIGFDELTFLNCKFSERTKLRTDRIEKIVVSAVKQSHKSWMPKVNDMQDFKSFITTPRPGRKFICHCYEEFPKNDLFNELNTNISPVNSGVSASITPVNSSVSASITPVNSSVSASITPVNSGVSAAINPVDSSMSAASSADITVLIGPEGDFSVDEVQLAIDHGYESVTLGKSRLRTETAGLMAVTMSNIARRI